jgi:hypothetical protein
VLIETLIALPVILAFFLSLVQLSFLQVANIVTQQAAYAAARAAAVVLPDDPAYYGGVPVDSPTGARMDEIRGAARMPLGVLSSNPDVDVTFPGHTGMFLEHDTARVRVALAYPCRVPIGGRIVCGLDSVAPIVHEAAMPNQGSLYQYP